MCSERDFCHQIESLGVLIGDTKLCSHLRRKKFEKDICHREKYFEHQTDDGG